MTLTTLPRAALAAGGAIALIVLIGLFNLPQTLGAHPWWSQTILWIGAPIGIVLAWVLSWKGPPKLWAVGGFVIFTVASVGAAHWGKAVFAASYAEDQLAGQIWYFGWIAAAAFFAATVTRALSR